MQATMEESFRLSERRTVNKVIRIVGLNPLKSRQKEFCRFCGGKMP